jgi:hypothetical protein
MQILVLLAKSFRVVAIATTSFKTLQLVDLGVSLPTFYHCFKALP